MINNVVLMGRLTADPEIRTTKSGVNVCRFTLAIDRYSKGDEKKTDFIQCQAWRQTAEFIGKYFCKGSLLALVGSIQTDSYTDKDGKKVYSTAVVADKVSFCGSKTENNKDSLSAATPPSYSSPPNGDFEEIPDEEDLPF